MTSRLALQRNDLRDRLAVLEPAARAMLAALESASEMLRDMNAGQNGPLEPCDLDTEARIHAAIAQAKAAGL